MKKNILICSYNPSNVIDFYNTGLIDKLKEKYKIDFIFERDYKTNRFKESYLEDLKKENINFKNSKNSFFQNFLNSLFRIKFFSNQIHRFILHKRYRSFKESISSTLCLEGPKYIPLFNFLYIFKLHKLFDLIVDGLYKILSFKNLNLIEKNYDLVIFPYKMTPASNFIDKCINEAKNKKIKTFGVQLNWDNIPDRYTKNLPDYLSVLGQQPFDYLFTTYSISPHRIFTNGSLKVESFENLEKIEKKFARKKLNIPEDKTIIAFVPSGDHFDEIFILKSLDKIKSTINIFQNCEFYVKGYRGGQKITIKESLFQEYRKEIENDDYKYKNLIFWEPDELNLSEKEFFQYFYKSVDGIISNYSSVILEAAYYKIPSIGLNYNPKEYGSFILDNWEFKNYWPHTYAFRNYQIVRDLEINNREEFKDKVEKFYNIILSDKKNEISNIFKNISNLCIANFDDKPSEKIMKSITEILKEDFEKSNSIEKKVFES